MPIGVADIAFSGPSALLRRHQSLEEKRYCRRQSPLDNGMILLPIFNMTGRAAATAGPNLSADNSGRPILVPPAPR
jgi:hypothetical protein